RPDSGPLVALDVEPPDPDALELAVGWIVGPAQRVDDDRAPRGGERLRLAANPRVFFVVAVGQHRDRPATGVRGAGMGLHGSILPVGGHPPSQPERSAAIRSLASPDLNCSARKERRAGSSAGNPATIRFRTPATTASLRTVE